MKSNYSDCGGLSRHLWTALVAAAFVLLGDAVTVRAQPKSPVGTAWDCVMSGERNGLALLEFSTTNGGTFSGWEVLVPKPLPSRIRTSLLAGDIGTNGLGVRTSVATTHPDIFGSVAVSGPWGFDSRGRIIGTFVEVARRDTCVTNLVAVSTNAFVSPVVYSQTNTFAGGYCATFPVGTNMIPGTGPGTYTEQLVCFALNVAISTNTFESLNPITSTSRFADGHVCVTFPTGVDTNTGNYIEVIACYSPSAAVISNTFPSAIPIFDLSTNSGGTACVTQPIATNMVPGGYLEQTVCYVDQIDCPGTLTNIVNFVGTVVPGRRLTLVCSTTFGKLTYLGVPFATLPDIRGSWYGIKRQHDAPTFEFFNLVGSGPNRYSVSGQGPYYLYNDGLALLSRQGRLAFSLRIMDAAGTTHLSTRAVMGSFNSHRVTATTTGIDSIGGIDVGTNRISFQVTRRTSLP